MIMPTGKLVNEIRQKKESFVERIQQEVIVIQKRKAINFKKENKNQTQTPSPNIFGAWK